MKTEATRDFEWIIERTGCILTANARAIQAVDDRGVVRGMVAYDCWTPNSVWCHMAVEAPIVWRSLIPVVFAYPLQEAGRGVLLACNSARNEKAVNLTRRLGFSETHRVRDGWAPGEDLIFWEMRKENCRFLTRSAA